MNFLKALRPIAFTAVIVCSNINAMPLTDPFLQEWAFFDGVNTYKLIISPSNMPGQNYHIYYTFPGGDSSTDMCVATSGTSFHCVTGETVTRDDNQHLVELESDGQLHVFYDPKHMPIASYIFGRWNYHYQKGDYSANFSINIKRGPSDMQYNVTTGFKDNQGNYCSYDVPDSYQVTKNLDGSELISRGKGALGYHFKFDPQKKQIINPRPGQTFDVGLCVQLYEKQSDAIFTKE